LDTELRVPIAEDQQLLLDGLTRMLTASASTPPQGLMTGRRQSPVALPEH
jgi:hypothetical protein